MANIKDISKASFSELMKELEHISAWLEEEQVDLDKALAQFERGMELVGELQNRLHGAEQKIEKIKLRLDPKNRTE